MDTLEDANFTKSVLHHREKRSLALLGKANFKLGVVYCAIPFLCPVGKGFKKIGKLATKGGKSVTKLAPVPSLIDLKRAKLRGDKIGTKTVLKAAPAFVKFFKKAG